MKIQGGGEKTHAWRFVDADFCPFPCTPAGQSRKRKGVRIYSRTRTTFRMAFARQQDRITPLKNAHKGILRQLDLLRVGIVESPPPPEPRGLEESIDRLESLVGTHFRDEEKNLYKPLKAKLGRDGPIDAMAHEHWLIRQTLRRLRSASVEYETDLDRIVGVRSCFDLLQSRVREHLEREETVLFWLADLKL